MTIGHNRYYLLPVSAKASTLTDEFLISKFLLFIVTLVLPFSKMLLLSSEPGKASSALLMPSLMAPP